jgi:DNA transformation protein
MRTVDARSQVRGSGMKFKRDAFATMAVTEDFLQYVLDQLAGLGQVIPRRMFGGVGLYHGERIFGLIIRDTLYFKVNDSNRPDYEARGMDRFRPYPNRPQLSMTYYEVPADALEDAEECIAWARKSTAVAVATKPAARRAKNPGLRRRRIKKR